MNTLQKSIEQEKTSPFFISWVKLEKEIRVLISKRDKKADAFMTKGILIYKALLEQCSTEEEVLMPLNNAERLAFIEENPSNYAAFRQLQELFNEMDKKIASKRAMLGSQ
ncbi:MAG TPA: hypothetical protein VK945_04235 [Planococcus sp. (in: firmicutes)]|nr:hypothetical protein [Planococcus sp. (in: firmicutes)]